MRSRIDKDLLMTYSHEGENPNLSSMQNSSEQTANDEATKASLSEPNTPSPSSVDSTADLNIDDLDLETLERLTNPSSSDAEIASALTEAQAEVDAAHHVAEQSSADTVSVNMDFDEPPRLKVYDENGSPIDSDASDSAEALQSDSSTVVDSLEGVEGLVAYDSAATSDDDSFELDIQNATQNTEEFMQELAAQSLSGDELVADISVTDSTSSESTDNSDAPASIAAIDEAAIDAANEGMGAAILGGNSDSDAADNNAASSVDTASLESLGASAEVTQDDRVMSDAHMMGQGDTAVQISGERGATFKHKEVVKPNLSSAEQDMLAQILAANKKKKPKSHADAASSSDVSAPAVTVEETVAPVDTPPMINEIEAAQDNIDVAADAAAASAQDNGSEINGEGDDYNPYAYLNDVDMEDGVDAALAAEMAAAQASLNQSLTEKGARLEEQKAQAMEDQIQTRARNASDTAKIMEDAQMMGEGGFTAIQGLEKRHLRYEPQVNTQITGLSDEERASLEEINARNARNRQKQELTIAKAKAELEQELAISNNDQAALEAASAKLAEAQANYDAANFEDKTSTIIFGANADSYQDSVESDAAPYDAAQDNAAPQVIDVDESADNSSYDDDYLNGLAAAVPNSQPPQEQFETEQYQEEVPYQNQKKDLGMAALRHNLNQDANEIDPALVVPEQAQDPAMQDPSAQAYYEEAADLGVAQEQYYEQNDEPQYYSPNQEYVDEQAPVYQDDVYQGYDENQAAMQQEPQEDGSPYYAVGQQRKIEETPADDDEPIYFGTYASRLDRERAAREKAEAEAAMAQKQAAQMQAQAEAHAAYQAQAAAQAQANAASYAAQAAQNAQGMQQAPDAAAQANYQDPDYYQDNDQINFAGAHPALDQNNQAFADPNANPELMDNNGYVEPAGMGDGVLSGASNNQGVLNTSEAVSADGDVTADDDGPHYIVGSRAARNQPSSSDDSAPVYAVGVGSSTNADVLKSIQAARAKLDDRAVPNILDESDGFDINGEPKSAQDIAYEKALTEAARKSMAAPVANSLEDNAAQAAARAADLAQGEVHQGLAANAGANQTNAAYLDSVYGAQEQQQFIGEGAGQIATQEQAELAAQASAAAQQAVPLVEPGFIEPAFEAATQSPEMAMAAPASLNMDLGQQDIFADPTSPAAQEAMEAQAKANHMAFEALQAAQAAAQAAQAAQDATAAQGAYNAQGLADSNAQGAPISSDAQSINSTLESMGYSPDKLSPEEQAALEKFEQENELRKAQEQAELEDRADAEAKLGAAAASHRREDNGNLNFANMPSTEQVGFGMTIFLYLRQLLASFFTHTTLPLAAPHLAVKFGPCYPSSMPIPFFFIGLISAAIGSALHFGVGALQVGAVIYTFFLLMTGLTAYRGIYRFCSFICRRRHDTILIAAAFAVPMMMLCWTFNAFVLSTSSMAEATLSFAVVSMVSAASAASLTWNFPQDPMDSIGKMSTKGLLFIIILSCMGAFGLLDPVAGTSIIAIALVSRIICGYFIKKNKGTAQRPYVYALQMIAMFFMLLDMIAIVKPQGFNILSTPTMQMLNHLATVIGG